MADIVDCYTVVDPWAMATLRLTTAGNNLEYSLVMLSNTPPTTPAVLASQRPSAHTLKEEVLFVKLP